MTFRPGLSANVRLKTFNGKAYSDFPVSYLAPDKPVAKSEVVVEARLRGRKSSKKEKADNKAESLKRIEIATTGLTVEEEDNVVSVSTGPMGHAVDVSLQVPASTSLKLGCMNEGGILVEKVAGEIEANNLNGPVTLTNVSSPPGRGQGWVHGRPATRGPGTRASHARGFESGAAKVICNKS